MGNELIVNATAHETRVALIENGSVAELYIERTQDKGIVGNIYKGKVARVLPGMQAAFVDIGLEKSAFLYVKDVLAPERRVNLEEEAPPTVDEDFEGEGEMEIPETPTVDEEALRNHGYKRNYGPQQISDLLKEGQEILVQATKNQIGTKGARLTMFISIPGRNLVLMPAFRHVGVSRRIPSEKERRRLRDLVYNFCPKDVGVIVRTACENKRASVIKNDLDYLLKIWREIEKDLTNAPAPYLLHEELDIVLRTLRDMFIDDIDRIIVDSKKEHKQILRFLEHFNPNLKRAIKFYKGREPIFDTYNIEAEINRALGRRVWLKSGGYIIVDQAEALTVIDVNTGRYVGKRNFEETILKINLEAAREIANQLRLRNCGGIIIVDFIDMENPHHRERVYRTFEEALKKDRAKNAILKISELGLIEMTRKRTRESLAQTLCEPCSYCEGKGILKNKRTICYEIFRELSKSYGDIQTKEIILYAHPDIAKLIEEEEIESIHKIEKIINKQIKIEAMPDYHIEQFEIRNIVT